MGYRPPHHPRTLSAPRHTPNGGDLPLGFHPTATGARWTFDQGDRLVEEKSRGRSEVIHRRSPWRSFEAVEYATLEWVDWFNNRRLLEPIGSIPPAEAEANFYAALETEAMAA